mmetsp:Transcript_49005/g.91217  ORF Transcript_49005/g.91217 Transcript_49005/m.91217 type:complete len:632 (-) Transcript_49005:132-2027(-)
MVQLVAQPQDAALEAAYHAVEALTTMTRFAEACRQLLAKGSYPGRAMATRPPEEVVAGMMRDLFSGVAALLNAHESAILCLTTTLLKNLVMHELVWDRLRAEPADSHGTMMAGLTLAMSKPLTLPDDVDPNSWFQSTPFTNVPAIDAGSCASGDEVAYQIACDAAELVHAFLSNAWMCSRILEIPNYLEAMLINMTCSLQSGLLFDSQARNSAVALVLLTKTPTSKMIVLKRHPRIAALLTVMMQCFDQAKEHGAHEAGTPYLHSKNSALSAVSKLWAQLVECEALGQILSCRGDTNFGDILAAVLCIGTSEDAGIAAHAVVAMYRILKACGPSILVSRYPDTMLGLMSSLCRGLSCPEPFVAESACAAIAIVMDDHSSRTWMIDQQPRRDLENLIGGLAQLMMHPDSAAAGIAADALCNLMTGPSGEVFLSTFMQGGLKHDAQAYVEASKPGFWDYILGRSSQTTPAEEVENFELVNNAFQVLDSVLLGLATVLRKPADKLAATNASEVLCAICAVESAWQRMMGQPFELLNAILSGLVELARCKERAAQRNAAVIIHCFTLDTDGMQILQEIDRTQSRNALLALHGMQTSGDSTTADLATGALSNLAQNEGWRARMQMLDMLNTFSLGR